MKLRGSITNGIFQFIPGVTYTRYDIIQYEGDFYIVLADYDGLETPDVVPDDICINWIKFNEYSSTNTSEIALITANSFYSILRSYFKGLSGNGELEHIEVKSISELNSYNEVGAYMCKIHHDGSLSIIPDGEYILKVFKTHYTFTKDEYRINFNNIHVGAKDIPNSSTTDPYAYYLDDINLDEAEDASVITVQELIDYRTGMTYYRELGSDKISCNMSLSNYEDKTAFNEFRNNLQTVFDKVKSIVDRANKIIMTGFNYHQIPGDLIEENSDQFVIRFKIPDYTFVHFIFDKNIVNDSSMPHQTEQFEFTAYRRESGTYIRKLLVESDDPTQLESINILFDSDTTSVHFTNTNVSSNWKLIAVYYGSN